MQEMLGFARRLVYPAAMVFLLWAGWQILFSPYVSDSKGRMLAVYDGDTTVADCEEAKRVTPDKENVSEEALSGFCRAVRALPKPGPEVDLLNIHDVGDDRSESRITKIYQLLASRVARGSVLGVVSLLTSPDSPPLVRFCRTMQIPLLLAVAANDDLMAASEDTHGLVFRMMPTNGRQARDMAAWLGRQIQGSRVRMAVFHEPNAFGEFLQRELTHELQAQLRRKQINLYNFEVTEEMQFADLMPQLWCQNVDMIVYLGFASRAMDLLSKLRWYRPGTAQGTCRAADATRSFDRVTVLLSSGAYNEEMNDPDKYEFPFRVFAMLPTSPAAARGTTPPPDAAPGDEETAASEYGYDSFNLLVTLGAQQFKIPSQPIAKSKTGHDYHFDKDGELVPADKNSYQAYLLGSPAATGKQ